MNESWNILCDALHEAGEYHAIPEGRCPKCKKGKYQCVQANWCAWQECSNPYCDWNNQKEEA